MLARAPSLTFLKTLTRQSVLGACSLLMSNAASADFEGRIYGGYVDWQTDAPDIVIPADVLFPDGLQLDSLPPEFQAIIPELPETITVPLNSPNASVYALGLGGTYFVGRYFVDAYVTGTSEDSFDLNASTDTNAQAFGGNNIAFQESFDASRTDAAIAGGYAITDRIAAFAGYKFSSAEAVSAFGSGSRVAVDHTGFFVGATYAIPFQAQGTLVFNMALAVLDGDFIVDIDSLDPDLAQVVNVNASSESLGMSYGLSWKAQLNEHLNYGIQLNGYEYNFKDVTDERRGPVGDYGDQLLGLTLSLSHDF